MSTPDLICGIDPGIAGGISILDRDGGVVGAWPMPETEHETVELIAEFAGRISKAVIERVQPMPTGTIAMFKLGRSYGLLRGILSVLAIPFDEVGAKTWQKSLGIVYPREKTNGTNKKTITRQKAQQLFPSVKVTNGNADSLLLAEYARRQAGNGGA